MLGIMDRVPLIGRWLAETENHKVVLRDVRAVKQQGGPGDGTGIIGSVPAQQASPAGSGLGDSDVKGGMSLATVLKKHRTDGHGTQPDPGR